MDEIIKLSKYSHSSGCGCKIAPAVLDKILKNNTSELNFPGLLVGNISKDDAAVFDLGDDRALISTTDFFMPIVDDPFDFGRIAAANAISDVYAMGGKPLLAVAILGWPVDKLPAELAQKIIEGGRSICKEAGIPLAGGHSIDSPEPIFGLSVNGLVNVNQVKKNNTAKEGDVLFLTKPLGTGIMATAMKRGLLKEGDYDIFLNNMVGLNKIGEELGKIREVNALTDVTGFGLLGHLIEICEGSRLSAEIDYKKVPLLKGVEHYANQFCFPDNTYRNWNSFESKVEGINGTSFITLCDPQTSGGLLISIAQEGLGKLEKLFKEYNLSEYFQPIGMIIRKEEKVVRVIE
jgi:selenide, water dikinase